MKRNRRPPHPWVSHGRLLVYSVIAYLIVRRDARKRPLEQVAGAPGDRPRQSFSQCARSLAASGSVVVRGGTRSYCDHVPMFVWWSVILVLQTTDDMSCERRTKAARFLDLRWVRILTLPVTKLPFSSPRWEWHVAVSFQRMLTDRQMLNVMFWWKNSYRNRGVIL